MLGSIEAAANLTYSAARSRNRAAVSTVLVLLGMIPPRLKLAAVRLEGTSRMPMAEGFGSLIEIRGPPTGQQDAPRQRLG